MIRVTCVYNATVIIETPDVRILCDPWQSQGVYDGAWYRYPDEPVPMQRYDLIWISHIHPDHFDPDWLAAYRSRYPDVPICYTADPGGDNPLAHVFPELGMTPLDRLCAGATTIAAFPCHASRLDPDSALVVSWRGQHVADMNDCAPDPAQIEAIKEFCGGAVTAGLIKYTGVGPFPQCYMPLDGACIAMARHVQGAMLRRYRETAEALGAGHSIPFAGDFWLGGRVAHLNRYRTWISKAEAAKVLPGAVPVANGSAAVITAGGIAIDGEADTRVGPPHGIREHLRRLSTYPMAWESWDGPAVTERDLRRAVDRATEAADGWQPDIDINIVAGDLDFHASLGNGAGAGRQALTMYVPRRYLSGLVAGDYHFNDAEIGSQYLVDRNPDVYRRDVMEWFHGFRS